MKIIQVVGARPNFMKVAPLHRALRNHSGIESLIVHTGQHSDPNMSEIFLEQFDLPKPDFFLGVSGGTHSQMMAKIMIEFENVVQKEKPQLIVVVGDVNSTLACALVAAKMNIPLAHVEAGLRSRDRSMPEEINRILTDQLSDYLFTTEVSANENLILENIPEDKIHFVGNCMIDSLVRYLPEANSKKIRKEFKIDDVPYALMTMHRPSNVDSKEGLENIVRTIEAIATRMKIVFPVHPRTLNKMDSFDLWNKLVSIDNLIVSEPLGYLEFLSLMKEASVVLTDSGGIQEETTYLKIPCLTFRKTTERPVTVEEGSNIMIDNFNRDQVMTCINQILNGQWKESNVPELWDGHAAGRIAEFLLKQGE